MVEFREGGASTARATVWSKFKIWCVVHFEEARRSWQDIWRSPLSSLMTLMVVAIALALPASLTVALKNGERLADQVQSSSQITLYLKSSVSEAQAQELLQKLRRDASILDVQYMTREQSLAEFKTQSGFGSALDYLDDNPLPAVITVTPTLASNEPQAADVLLTRLRAYSEVDQAQLDMQWLRRLHALMQLGRRAAMILSLLLGMAVVLIVGNTIRLAIQNRHTEIEVFKLVGATDAFIRRPFLYSGLWFGIIGGLLAWGMISAALWWLDSPMATLADLYQSDFRAHGLSLDDILRLLAFGGVLGLGGSVLSVNQHLRSIEPR